MNYQMPSCPQCGGALAYYDGALGYESLQCQKCRWDIAELNAMQTLADMQSLRAALLAMVACPDYRHIDTHEMHRARQVLAETQPMP